MKKLTLISVILLAHAIVFCQSNIEGIGKLKLGITTTKFVDSLAKEHKIRIQQFKALSEFVKYNMENGNTIIEILPNNSSGLDYEHIPSAPYCPNLRTFYFKVFVVTPTITMREVYTQFLNDTLVTIKGDYSLDIKEAMTIKYGSPATKTKIDSANCERVISGQKFKREEIQITDKWESIDNNISVSAYSHKYYNYKCEEKYISIITFNFKNSTIFRQNEACKAEIMTKLKQKDLESKKKALEGF